MASASATPSVFLRQDVGLPAEDAGRYAAACDAEGYDTDTLMTMSIDALVTELQMKRGHARKVHNCARGRASSSAAYDGSGSSVSTATAVPVAGVGAVVGGGATETAPMAVAVALPGNTAMPLGASASAIPTTSPIAMLVPPGCGGNASAQSAARSAAATASDAGAGIGPDAGLPSLDQYTDPYGPASAGTSDAQSLPSLGTDPTERYGSLFGPQCGRLWNDSIPIMDSWVEVRWNDGKWYRGRVVSFDAHSGTHHVQYEDGDEKDYHLAQKDFRVFMWADGTMGV